MSTWPSRWFFKWVAALTVLAGGLRLFGLWSYLPTGDDYLVPITADFYTATGQPYPTEPFHPVLRNLFASLSMSIFGRGAFGVKFFSLVLGILLVVVVALFVRRAAQNERAGMLAGLFVAVDILLIDYSRQALQEVHVAFFAVLGAWLVAEALALEETHAWRWLLPIAGLSFGLGVSSKLYAVMPLAVSLVVLTWVSVRRRRADEALTVASSLVLLPSIVFLLTYAPWFGRGYDFAEWLTFQKATLEAMVTHSRPMIGFLANSHPALWFITPFYSFADYVDTATRSQLAVGLGNPLVWLAVLPAAAYSLANPILRKQTALLQVYFWAAYLPLAMSPRPIWMLSAVSVAPFAFGLIAPALADAWERREQGRARTIVAVYLILVMVTTALLYPLAIGRARDVRYLKPIVDRLGIEHVTTPAQGR